VSSKVKLSLCLITHYVMELLGRVEGSGIPPLLTSALNGGEWLNAYVFDTDSNGVSIARQCISKHVPAETDSW
jgi:hypothetical protein